VIHNSVACDSNENNILWTSDLKNEDKTQNVCLTVGSVSKLRITLTKWQSLLFVYSCFFFLSEKYVLDSIKLNYNIYFTSLFCLHFSDLMSKVCCFRLNHMQLNCESRDIHFVYVIPSFDTDPTVRHTFCLCHSQFGYGSYSRTYILFMLFSVLIRILQ
jgi:hypothetical protein